MIEFCVPEYGRAAYFDFRRKIIAMISNFDIDWWAFLIITLAAGAAWWLALIAATVLTLITRKVDLPDCYSPIRAYSDHPEIRKLKTRTGSKSG
jgi:hypothetical protein